MSSRSGPLSVVLAGGGSAGHVSPLLAIAAALRVALPEVRLTAVGTAEGLETRLVPAAGVPLELIDRAPLPRRLNRAALDFPGRFRRSLAESARILAATEAEVLVGVGGYVCTPMYLAARRARLPIVIHEANIRPGLANRLGARYTGHIGKAFESTKLGNAAWVGMPMRKDIAELDRAAYRDTARRRLGLSLDQPVVILTGGSLGAVRMNDALSETLPDFAAAGIQVLHLTGAGKALTGPDGAPVLHSGYQQLEYLDDMSEAYAAADLMICRAGAGTVCEIAAAGVPAVFVPLAYGNGEQVFNAKTLVDRGAAKMILNQDFTPARIRSEILPLLVEPGRLAAMGAQAKNYGIRDGAEQMVDMILRAKQ